MPHGLSPSWKTLSGPAGKDDAGLEEMERKVGIQYNLTMRV
jgi:hypothetical protein